MPHDLADFAVRSESQRTLSKSSAFLLYLYQGVIWAGRVETKLVELATLTKAEEAGRREHGPWTAGELTRITRAEIAHALGQDPDHVLMGHFERHLRELGERVGGSFAALAGAAPDVEALATTLAQWPTWQDVRDVLSSRLGTGILLGAILVLAFDLRWQFLIASGGASVEG